MDLLCYTRILGKKPGQRIGIVKWYEMGYYPCNYDSGRMTDEEVEQFVDELNRRLEIPKDVAESAADASMFGWHVPAAQRAIEFFKKQSLEQ